LRVTLEQVEPFPCCVRGILFRMLRKTHSYDLDLFVCLFIYYLWSVNMCPVIRVSICGLLTVEIMCYHYSIPTGGESMWN
jgi:hypothetical protein